MAAKDFQPSVENLQVNIDVSMNAQILDRVQENRHIVKSILYCGRQCIALRDNVEKLDQTGNPGNFLSLMKVLANHDPTLKNHLERPRLRNATYLFPQTQNEIIDIIGKRIIQKSIVAEAKQAPFYSILVDEVTSFNREFMPLCVSREEFLQFSYLTRVTGDAIAVQICKDLEDLGMQLSDIRGQGYDGAANMASKRVGVQACREKSSLATHTHCSGHCLNVVISLSCALPVVSNVLDTVKVTCLFFLNSP